MFTACERRPSGRRFGMGSAFAMGRKSDSDRYSLQVEDVLELEIERVGVKRQAIVAGPDEDWTRYRGPAVASTIGDNL